MKKEIKDYLHLYLGCEVFYDSKTWKLRMINDRHAYLRRTVRSHSEDNTIHLHDAKPMLRPLSDMTEEEAEHLAWLCMDSNHVPDKSYRIDKDEIQIELAKWDNATMLDGDVEIYIGISCRCWEGSVMIKKDGSISRYEEEDQNPVPIHDISEKIMYLLSKHFDLFGLIESGLAIDKTLQTA